MTQQEIINQAQKLPISQQREIVQTLAQGLAETKNDALSEAEIAEILLAKGIISKIPAHWNDDEDFEPIEIEGEPISETIIRERR
ncbi:MAG: hypothetical protein M3367_11525 [Acidobacteriota bacterium]|nr:hypothetical protein [Acidobacteriota bacterium]